MFERKNNRSLPNRSLVTQETWLLKTIPDHLCQPFDPQLTFFVTSGKACLYNTLFLYKIMMACSLLISKLRRVREV
jgi:hypothetical protein